jgi:hypothetical protein
MAEQLDDRRPSFPYISESELELDLFEGYPVERTHHHNDSDTVSGTGSNEPDDVDTMADLGFEYKRPD